MPRLVPRDEPFLSVESLSSLRTPPLRGEKSGGILFVERRLGTVLPRRISVGSGRRSAGRAVGLGQNGRDPMAGIRYIMGDATCPQAKGVKLICHVCNDMGRWGKGFVVAVSRRWRQPEEQYRAWYARRSGEDFRLGAQFIQVEPYIWVANMVAQRGTKVGSSGPPIRYEALAECLDRVGEKASELKASVHMPRIGCGLAGGDWSRVEPLIVRSIIAQGLPISVYDTD